METDSLAFAVYLATENVIAIDVGQPRICDRTDRACDLSHCGCGIDHQQPANQQDRGDKSMGEL
jgi:hypothetical protein